MPMQDNCDAAMANSIDMFIRDSQASDAVRLIYLLSALSFGGDLEWRLMISDPSDGRKLTIRWLGGLWRMEFEYGQCRAQKGVENIGTTAVVAAVRAAYGRSWDQVMSACGMSSE